MCGITGIAYSGGLADAQDIQRMTVAFAHRGPDGEGFIGINTISRKITALSGKKTPIAALPLREFGANADVYLAHRRLAILDLSKARHQTLMSYTSLPDLLKYEDRNSMRFSVESSKSWSANGTILHPVRIETGLQRYGVTSILFCGFGFLRFFYKSNIYRRMYAVYPVRNA
jgi:hypothetical protein